MGEIVVGYDGTDCSKAALDQALELAKEIGDSVSIVFGYGAVGPAGGAMPAHEQALKELGEGFTKEAVERAKGAGVEAEAQLIRKHAVDALLQVAEQKKARMVVVGTYGEPPLKGAILGSVPHKLLHLSEIPVLVVPA